MEKINLKHYTGFSVYPDSREREGVNNFRVIWHQRPKILHENFNIIKYILNGQKWNPCGISDVIEDKSE